MFRSCPRCSGDRCLERDSDGWYITCLHCGHVSYPEVFPDESRLAGRVLGRSQGGRVSVSCEARMERAVSALGG